MLCGGEENMGWRKKQTKILFVNTTNYRYLHHHYYNILNKRLGLSCAPLIPQPEEDVQS